MPAQRPRPRTRGYEPRMVNHMNIPNAAAHRATGPLHAVIAGDVLVPGDHGYDEARRAWNLAVDQRPAAVVIAEFSADVAQAVRFARARGMRIAPQGTFEVSGGKINAWRDYFDMNQFTSRMG